MPSACEDCLIPACPRSGDRPVKTRVIFCHIRARSWEPNRVGFRDTDYGTTRSIHVARAASADGGNDFTEAEAVGGVRRHD